MGLQFHRADEELEIWSAKSHGFSFVTSYQAATGPLFRGRPGYMASWRPLYLGTGAIKIIGSPFKTLEDAEGACNEMLDHLRQARGS